MWGGEACVNLERDKKKRAPDTNKENISFQDQVIIRHCEKVVK